MEGDECTLDTDGDKIADYEVSKSFIIYYIIKYNIIYITAMYMYVYSL